MKKDIHPKYNTSAKVVCACGASFTTGSTEPNISVEVCSECHPFYTGKSRLVDTQGIVDKYQSKASKAKKLSEVRRGKKVKRTLRAQKKKEAA